MNRKIGTFDSIYNDVWALRTKSADINDDIKSVLANLDAVNKSETILQEVKDNYFRLVCCYVEIVKDLKVNSDLKRYTRAPYDKVLETFYLIVYDHSTDPALIGAIIEPLRDVMALQSVKKVPLEIMLVIMAKIEKLTLNTKEYIRFSERFAQGDVSEEEAEACDHNTDTRAEILNDIGLVADTFFDLRLLKTI